MPVRRRLCRRGFVALMQPTLANTRKRKVGNTQSALPCVGGRK